MQTKVIEYRIEVIAAVAKQLIEDNIKSSVFAFYGSMGVGKTTLIKELCSYLGVKESTSSPTFAIINEYKTSSNESVFHFDFYRIKNLAEAIDIGIDDYFYSGAYCFIEWPEKIESLLPLETLKVCIEEQPDNKRTLSIF